MYVQRINSLAGVIKHYEDFLCVEVDTAICVKEVMQKQWEWVMVPGLRVKVKFKEKVVPGVVVNCYYTSKVLLV